MYVYMYTFVNYNSMHIPLYPSLSTKCKDYYTLSFALGTNGKLVKFYPQNVAVHFPLQAQSNMYM